MDKKKPLGKFKNVCFFYFYNKTHPFFFFFCAFEVVAGAGLTDSPCRKNEN